MKINIELDMTPDEAKELLLLSDKQVEFAAKMNTAYTQAVHDIVLKTAQENMKNFGFMDGLNVFSLDKK